MQCSSLITTTRAEAETEHEGSSDSEDSDLDPAGTQDHSEYYGRGWQAGAAAGYCAGSPAEQEPATQALEAGSSAAPPVRASGTAAQGQRSTQSVAPVRGCFKPVPVRFTHLEHPQAPARGSEGHNNPLTQSTPPRQAINSGIVPGSRNS